MTLLQDLRHAWRILRRDRATSAVIVFTLAVTANFVDMAVRPPHAPDLVTYFPLFPLLLLWLTGLYLFVLPYVSKARSAG